MGSADPRVSCSFDGISSRFPLVLIGWKPKGRLIRRFNSGMIFDLQFQFGHAAAAVIFLMDPKESVSVFWLFPQ